MTFKATSPILPATSATERWTEGEIEQSGVRHDHRDYYEDADPGAPVSVCPVIARPPPARSEGC